MSLDTWSGMKSDPAFGRLWSLNRIATVAAILGAVLCSSVGVLLYLA